MIILTDAAKACDKIQNSLMIYLLRKLITEESFLNLVCNMQNCPSPHQLGNKVRRPNPHHCYSTQHYVFQPGQESKKVQAKALGLQRRKHNCLYLQMA